MKKDQQYAMNEYVEKNYEIMRNSLNGKFTDFKPFRSCQADVWETEKYVVLRSYSTIVAFIDKMTGQKFDVLRLVYGYTATSAQHIAKFFADFGDFRVSTYTYREV